MASYALNKKEMCFDAPCRLKAESHLILMSEFSADIKLRLTDNGPYDPPVGRFKRFSWMEFSLILFHEDNSCVDHEFGIQFVP